jgi:PAS domain S-box-containing protein
LKATPYFSLREVVALASILAMPLQAQGVAGRYSDAVGLGAMGGIILLLLAWAGSMRRQLRRIMQAAGARASGPEAPAQEHEEAAWKDERKILNELLEHASDQIYFKDRQSRFRWCCKAVCKRFGVTQQEIIGKTDFDFFDERHARPAFEDEQEILRTGRAFLGKMEREVMKDGSEHWALTAKMPLRPPEDVS